MKCVLLLFNKHYIFIPSPLKSSLKKFQLLTENGQNVTMTTLSIQSTITHLSHGINIYRYITKFKTTIHVLYYEHTNFYVISICRLSFTMFNVKISNIFTIKEYNNDCHIITKVSSNFIWQRQHGR